MTKSKALAALTLLVGLATTAFVTGQQARSSGSTLTDQDRAQIHELAVSYGRALGTCAANEYAGLFAAPDGYFASGPRGKVAGRDKLIALVLSERHCHDGSDRRPRNIPIGIDIEPSPEGATGNVFLGVNAGHYEDVYVKTAQGWRFKSHAYLSTQEEAAHLTARDFIEIRQLAGNDSGQFEDIYLTAPEGKHFRSSGVVITPAPDGAVGRAYLKNDGGHYDDVYVKTSHGWRFKSRIYVAPEEQAGSRPSGDASTPAGSLR
jgi:hypothetical protein